MDQQTELPALVAKSTNILQDSWKELNEKLTKDSGIKANTKLAARGSAEDIFGLIPVLVDAHEKCHTASVGQYQNMVNNLPPKGNPSSINSALEEIKRLAKIQREFASCYKALFLFLRAFQDAMVRVLFEVIGKDSGAGTSMSKLLGKNNKSSLRSDLESKLPQYSLWVKSFKKIRDNMKYGLDVSHGCEIGPQQSVLLIHTRRINQGPDRCSVHAIENELSLHNILEALEMSNALVNFIKEYC